MIDDFIDRTVSSFIENQRSVKVGSIERKKNPFFAFADRQFIALNDQAIAAFDSGNGKQVFVIIG